MNADAARVYAGMYGPSVAELCKHLPDAGDSAANAMANLCRDPSFDGCDRTLLMLECLKRQVWELRLVQQRGA